VASCGGIVIDNEGIPTKGGHEFFHGCIDEVAVYIEAMDDAVVIEHYVAAVSRE